MDGGRGQLKTLGSEGGGIEIETRMKIETRIKIETKDREEDSVAQKKRFVVYCNG